ncbi:MAG: mannose-1-phosphate guanylyltransferase [Candidatus Dormibacteria bacterium]
MAFHVLVLAGGSGTRLWPLSRGTRPKHLLPLGPGGEPLLRTTVSRVAGLADVTWVVTAASQVPGCVEALGDAHAHVRAVAEPTARGTGPALGLAVAEIAADDPHAVVASVHADAWIGDPKAYRAAVLAAAGWAQATDGLAAVGLAPTTPATGLGYIALGETLDPSGWRSPGGPLGASLAATAASLPAARAAGFVEKPDRGTAEEFLAGGRHLWNLGLFAWTVGAMLREIDAADPRMGAHLREIVRLRRAGDDAAAAAIYASLPDTAIEPLVFERTGRLAVVRASFAWSDLGSWSDLAATRAATADPDGNIVGGDGLVIDSRNCLIQSSPGRLVAVVGAEGLVVVDTGDAVLVMPVAASQQAKAVVERLREAGRTDLV